MKTLMINQAKRIYAVVFLCMSVFFVYTNSVSAENIVTSGTTLRVTSGTTLVSSATLTLQNGSTLNNQGTIILSGNLNNLNASVSNLGTGTMNMGGTALQQINGQNTITNLTINNAAGVTLNGNTNVNGILTLSIGKLALGNYNLQLGTTASIGGAPSATAMVVATGTGELRKSFSAAGSFLFPVGDNTVTAEYSPVTLNFTAGSFAGGNYAGVSLVNAMYPGSPGGSYIKRYWNITQSGISGFSCNPTFQYLPADVVGTESSMFCVRIAPASVDYFNAANTALHQLTASGLTAFGTFTGYQTLTAKTLNLTLLLEGLYNVSGTMRKAQNATGDQFAGTIADQVNIELHNAAPYSSVAYVFNNVNISTAGACTASIPGILSGSYYVTIKHRNSVETTTASSVSFTASPITYSFTNLATKAYGSNMKLMSGGFWAIYGGDANQDGSVNSTDINNIYTTASSFSTGYLATDINGDGLVDAGDLITTDNNASKFVVSLHP